MEARLTGTIRSDSELDAWLASGGLRGVRTLVAWNLTLTDAGACALAGAVGARDLVDVDLSWNRIGAQGAAALAGALPQLRALRLYHNDVGAEGARAVADAAPSLERLNLCGNGVGDDGARHLARGLACVRDLALGFDDLGDAAARSLACLRSLETLNLRANRIGRDGAAALLAGDLPSLRRLGLDDNERLGDEGLEAILASPGFSALTWLNLGGVGIDDRAVERFARVPRGACALRELRVQDNDLSDEACAALRALPALAGCEVRT